MRWKRKKKWILSNYKRKLCRHTGSPRYSRGLRNQNIMRSAYIGISRWKFKIVFMFLCFSVAFLTLFVILLKVCKAKNGKKSAIEKFHFLYKKEVWCYFDLTFDKMPIKKAKRVSTTLTVCVIILRSTLLSTLQINKIHLETKLMIHQQRK